MPKSLVDLSTEELVMLFQKNCLAQDELILSEMVAGFKKLYDQMMLIRKELSRRGERSALTRLHEDKNPQVKLQSAMATLIVTPLEARDLLEAISLSGMMPQAADATETIRDLESGIFQPS